MGEAEHVKTGVGKVGRMDGQQRATVYLRRSAAREDRLRQALIDGLVRKEVRQDIEAVIADAEEARKAAKQAQRDAEDATARAEALTHEVAMLNRRISMMQSEATWKAGYYSQAQQAYQRDRDKAKEREDTKYTIAVGGGAFVIVVLGGLIAQMIFKILY